MLISKHSGSYYEKYTNNTIFVWIDSKYIVYLMKTNDILMPCAIYIPIHHDGVFVCLGFSVHVYV